MKLDRKNLNVTTKLTHPVEVELTPGNRPLLSPIYHSAKFSPSENAPYWDQFIYTRVSNPTTRQLELTLAELQNKEDCIVMSSGIAAITGTFLSLLSAGDHIISFRELYKPARVYIKDFLPRYNIEYDLLGIHELDQLEKVVKPGKTKLIHFESPTNPGLEIAEIQKIIKFAKKHGILVSMDGTFAGLHQHSDFDIDIMIQSLTKFGNGHGDVIAGSVAGSKSLMHKIREMSIYLGTTLDPQASYLIERGLKTYMLRYEKQTQTAFKVAQFLEQHPKVQNVRYPGLKTHPQYELAHEQMTDMGAVIAFELIEGDAAKFCHTTELIQFTASLGSCETIICPTDIFFGTDLSSSEKIQMRINSRSLRLSIGLEDSQDIIADLEETLAQ